MMRYLKLLLPFLLIANLATAQEEPKTDEDGNPIEIRNKKGMQVGIYMGCLFANQKTAILYDGYGFDIEGNRYAFVNSFMYNKIVMEYGGGYGMPDLIAPALGVQHGEWFFDEDDMPTNMRYQPGFAIGLQGRYSVDGKNAILLNANACQLTITGNFTITTIPPSGSTQINDAIKTCAIKGGEQRLMLQLGYQHLFGESEKMNFLMEGGMNVTMAKFDKNQILIGDLMIDLTSSFNQAGYPGYVTRKPTGVGLGAFAGAGFNFNMNESFRVQFLYNPSYEGINLEARAKLRFQNSISLRIYYSFK